MGLNSVNFTAPLSSAIPIPVHGDDARAQTGVKFAGVEIDFDTITASNSN